MSKPITSSTKKPVAKKSTASSTPRPKANPAQRELAARLLAIGGHSQEGVARVVGVQLRTVQRWHAEDAAFQARVDELRAMAIERIEPKVWALVELALENMRRMFAGEIKHDDPVYVESKSFLARFFERTFYVEPAAPAGGSAAAAATINLNVGAGGQPEPPRRAIDTTASDTAAG